MLNSRHLNVDYLRANLTYEQNKKIYTREIVPS